MIGGAFVKHKEVVNLDNIFAEKLTDRQQSANSGFVGGGSEEEEEEEDLCAEGDVDRGGDDQMSQTMKVRP